MGAGKRPGMRERKKLQNPTEKEKIPGDGRKKDGEKRGFG